MKHRSSAHIQYGPVRGIAGLETLTATALRTSFDRHFHDTYSFGLILGGVEACSLRKARRFFEPGTVPMFNPGEVHDGGPATEDGWSYRMVYLDPVLVPGERVFPFAERRDREARSAVAGLFDAIDCGSELGIDEALHCALDVLLETPAPRSFRARVVRRARAHRSRILEAAEVARPWRARRPLADPAAARLRSGLRPDAAPLSAIVPDRQGEANDPRGRSPCATWRRRAGTATRSHLNRWFLRIQGTTPGRLRRAFFS